MNDLYIENHVYNINIDQIDEAGQCTHEETLIVNEQQELLDHENCVRMTETHQCSSCGIFGIIIYYVPREIDWIYTNNDYI
jgi:hypothetical protein